MNTTTLKNRRQTPAISSEDQPTSVESAAFGAKSVETFRLVLITQVCENYGAHNWNGEGDCPQHWKFKGGNEYVRDVGTLANVMSLGHKGLVKVVQEMSEKVSENSESFKEYVIDWMLVPASEETYEEKDLREMLEEGYHITKEYVETKLKNRHI